MIKDLQQAAQAMNGKLVGANRDFVGISIDSRQIKKGNIFFALPGKHTDGKIFATKAIASGAHGIVVSQIIPDLAASQLLVTDTKLALGLLAASWRQLWPGQLIGITGNSGKTTVKNLLQQILIQACSGHDEQVLATFGNLNSYLGVPLTLCQLTPNQRFAVVEMGASHRGDLAWTSFLAQPQIALITNITHAHSGEFGGAEQIALAKLEILQGMSADRFAVLNQDDPFYSFWSRAAALKLPAQHIVSFGFQAKAIVNASNLRLQADGSYHFTLNIAGQSGEVHLPLLGKHNVSNALAAAAVSHILRLDFASIQTGLMRSLAANGRMQLYRLQNGTQIIDDSYNASPGAVIAALQTLATLPAPRWFIFGAMAELGPFSEDWHQQIAQAAKEAQVTQLLCYGQAAQISSQTFGQQGYYFADFAQLIEFIDKNLPIGASVLIKGARAMQMERVVQHLLQM